MKSYEMFFKIQDSLQCGEQLLHSLQCETRSVVIVAKVPPRLCASIVHVRHGEARDIKTTRTADSAECRDSRAGPLRAERYLHRRRRRTSGPRYQEMVTGSETKTGYLIECLLLDPSGASVSDAILESCHLLKILNSSPIPRSA